MAVPSTSQADRKAEAVRRSKRKAAADAASPEISAPDTGDSATATAVDPRSGSVSNGGGGSASSGELRVTQVGKKPAVCGTRTKAGDLIEFRCGGFSLWRTESGLCASHTAGKQPLANVAIVFLSVLFSFGFCPFLVAGGPLLVLFCFSIRLLVRGARALYVGSGQGGSTGRTARE